MTTRLEEELAAGMREHAAGTKLTRDVVGAATRRHRRRRAIYRATSAAGALGLAGAVAAVGLPGGLVSSSSTAGTPATSTPAMLNVAYVSKKVSAALADNSDEVMYARNQMTAQGRTTYSEFWRDGVTGDTRRRGVFSLASPAGTPH